MKGILFDLDGTLLPMDDAVFAQGYFHCLAQMLASYGYDTKRLVPAIRNGVKSVVKSDGTRTGEEVFWETFILEYGERVRHEKDLILSFYQNEFHDVKQYTQPTPLSKEIVRKAHEKAECVILATNPLFPYQGVVTRMGWTGLEASDFDRITSYETSRYCKPNPKYYEEILKKNNLKPKDCMMIGNDVNEDIIPAQSLGIKTYLVLDHVVGDPSLVETEKGSLKELLHWISELSH